MYITGLIYLNCDASIIIHVYILIHHFRRTILLNSIFLRNTYSLLPPQRRLRSFLGVTLTGDLAEEAGAGDLAEEADGGLTFQLFIF